MKSVSWTCRSRIPPPDIAPLENQPGGIEATRRNVAPSTAPYRPSSTASFSQTHCGQNRMHMAGMKKPVARAAAAEIRLADATSRASGFSQSTCLPASSAAIASGSWAGVGTQMSTTSTSGLWMTPWKSVPPVIPVMSSVSTAPAMFPHAPEKSPRARFASWSAMATSRASGTLA